MFFFFLLLSFSPLVHKNMTKRQLEQFKKYSQKLLLFCCFSLLQSHPPVVFFIIFFGNLRSKRKEKGESSRNKKRTLGFYNAEREHKKHSIMLSIKAICPYAPVERKTFFSYSKFSSSSFYSCAPNFLFLAIKFFSCSLPSRKTNRK